MFNCSGDKPNWPGIKGCFSGDGFSLEKTNGIVKEKIKIVKNSYIPSIDIQKTGVLWIDGVTLNCGSLSLQSSAKIILTNGAQIRVYSITTYENSKIVIYDDFKENEHIKVSDNSIKTNLGKRMLFVYGTWHKLQGTGIISSDCEL